MAVTTAFASSRPVRQVTMTSIPRSASANAVLRPRPRLPPVMRAIGVGEGFVPTDMGIPFGSRVISGTKCSYAPGSRLQTSSPPTDVFVPWAPGGNHADHEGTPAGSGGARAEGDWRALEGLRPVLPLRGPQAALGAAARDSRREPEGPGAAAPRDGDARSREPRGVRRGPSARRLHGHRAGAQPAPHRGGAL